MKKLPYLFAGIIGDTHFPFYDHKALDIAIGKLHRDMNLVIQVGDLYDQYSASRFPRNLNLLTPEKETEEARLCAWEMWAQIKQKCPRAELVQLMGNHDERPYKRAVDRTPELMHIVAPAFQALYEFKGVKTIHGASNDFEKQGVVFTHGYLSGPAAHARCVDMPVVRGHSHRGGVTWVREGLWELDAGFLGAYDSPVFGYSSWKRAYRMTRGMGIIDEHGPRFIPIEPKK